MFRGGKNVLEGKKIQAFRAVRSAIIMAYYQKRPHMY